MSIVELKDNELLVNGVKSSDLTSSMIDAGIDSGKVSELLGYLLLGASGSKRPPSFTFETEVKEEDEECTPTYQPAFSHQHWVDGQSRVQAGPSDTDPGMNARFETIEDDLAAISEPIEDLTACIARLRTEFHAVVRELETKITDLEQQLYDLKADDDYSPPVVVHPDDGIFLPTNPFTAEPTPSPYPTMPWQPETSITNLPGLAATFSTPAIQPGTFYNWNLERGGAIDEWRRDVSLVPRDLGSLRNFILTDERVRNAFEEGQTLEELTNDQGDRVVSKAGDRELTLSDTIKLVPRGTDVTTPEQLADAVAKGAVASGGDAMARAIKRTVLSGRAAHRTGRGVFKTDVEEITSLTNETKAALKQAGFESVGKLANASTPDLIKKVRRVARNVSPDDVTLAQANAKLALDTRNIHL